MARKLALKIVDQIGIVVRDIDKIVKTWERLFGIGPWNIREMSGIDAKGRFWKVRLAFADVGPVQIELIQPVEGRIFHSAFLETRGEGLHHLGFYVDDVDAEAANLVEQGAKILYTNLGNFAYMDIGGPDNVIFELIKRPEHTT